MGIEHLLSSWDDPCSGAEMQEKIDQSIGYFKMIHKHIMEIDDAGDLEPMDLCRQTVESMGLPPVAVNPLTARDFQSNVRNLDSEVLA